MGVAGTCFHMQSRTLALTLGLLTTFTCCGEGLDTSGAGKDTGPVTDIGFAGADVPPATDVAAIQDAGQTLIDDAQDGARRDPKIASVTLVGPANLKIGAIAKLTVAATTLTNTQAPTEAAVFADAGVEIEVGANLAHDSKNPPLVAVWKHADAGTWWIAALRPGDVSLTATISGVAAKPLELKLVWPATPMVRLSVPGSTAQMQAERQLDDSHTIRLTGKKLGAGGGTISLRFPLTVTNGDVFDLDNPPAKGGLAMQATFADLAGAKVTLAKGTVHIDETGKGLLRGVFHGMAANLKPIAGVFVVERQGKFGIDPLDTKPLQIGKSDAATPETGSHHSRLSLGAVDKHALVIHRHITGKYKAHLERRLLSPVSAKLTELPPIAADLTAYTGLPGGQPGPFNNAAGFATVAPSDPHFVIWEGRSEKGHSKPHGIWIRAYSPDYKIKSAIAQLTTDPCHGQCRPLSVEVNDVIHVFWRSTGGALNLRRVKKALEKTDVAFVDAKPVTLAPKASGIQVAAIGATVLIAWHDGSTSKFALLNSNELKSGTMISGTDASSAPVAIAAVSLAGSGDAGFFALFVCRKGKLHVEKVSTAGANFGNTAEVGDCYTDKMLAATGQQGQAIVLLRQPGNATYVVSALKVQWASHGADAKPLGDLWQLGKMVTGSFIDIALVRIDGANAFVAGWSGDHNSAGVFVRRFR
jgi:hypothetical protein